MEHVSSFDSSVHPIHFPITSVSRSGDPPRHLELTSGVLQIKSHFPSPATQLTPCPGVRHMRVLTVFSLFQHCWGWLGVGQTKTESAVRKESESGLLSITPVIPQTTLFFHSHKELLFCSSRSSRASPSSCTPV